MKILMTADTLGGVWTYALELIQGLAHYDVQVGLATMGRPLTPAQRRSLQDLWNVQVFESQYQLEWMNNPWRDVDAAGQWLLELRDQFQPDLIHLNDYSQGALEWERPVMVVGHSCVCSWMRHVRGSEASSEWDEYRKRVTRGVQRADCVVAPTQGMLQELQRYYGPLPAEAVIYNGRSGPLPHNVTRGPFILSAGRLWDEAKNISLLAEVARQLPWPIYVAGNSRHPDGMEAHNLSSLYLLGQLSQEELEIYMSRASIFAMPAKYEPFGLAPLEAAWNGCPLVLGDIPTLREVWGEAAVYEPPTSPQAWADRLNQLITDSPLRQQLAERAQQQAFRYSGEKMTRDYFQLYQQLLTGYTPELLPLESDV